MREWTRRAFLGGATAAVGAAARPYRRGRLLYEASLGGPLSVAGWTMEGPGEVSFNEGWMTMQSPGEAMHHVYWCPESLPASFQATWEMQNLHPEAGLCITFFCATGPQGEDVMDPALPARDGTFRHYNRGALSCYHISYYANTPNSPARPVSRLRKNPGANIVQEGPPGIPADSTAVHRLRLTKAGAHILLEVDDRTIIDWRDRGEVLGGAYGGGRLAFRQMQWSKFRYRGFRAWQLSGSPPA